MADAKEQYAELARIVGVACDQWTMIESVTHDIILHLAVYAQADFESTGLWDILHLVLCQMEARQKFATAKALAYFVDTKNSPDFFDRAESLLNYLDNEARNERNRFVHDHWEITDIGIIRSAMGAKVRRPKARQTVLTLWTDRFYESLNCVREFNTNLEKAYDDLVDLDNHIAWLVAQQRKPDKHTQPLPPVWRSLTHHGWREPHKRPPRPEPSEG